MQEALERGGLRVLTARALPANDGGLSYGQAVVAAAVLDAGLAQPRIMDGG
jgi:hydrogenase maturation protein HypF